MDFGRILLKSIHQKCWVRIEYKNQTGEVTKFSIGIKYIFPNEKKFKCDAFNLIYDKDVKNDYIIYYENIQDAELLENTIYDTPKSLEKLIYENPETISFMKTDISRDDLLDYYIDCFKLDSVPYISKYGLIKGIDSDVLMGQGGYDLSDKPEQFEALFNESFYKKEKKAKKKEQGIEKIEKKYIVNEIAINTSKGLYILAYRNIKLDIRNKRLIADKEILVNKEFQMDSDNGEIIYKESIHKYIPEDRMDLLENVEKNKQEILETIRQYNNTRNSTYKAEVKTDSKPYITCLETMLAIDIETEINEIKSYLRSGEEITSPLRTFFGDPESKLAKRKKYPIFTVDKYYDADQINAINIGMKSPASYIQGPPGTGKTKTLLNAVLTAIFNNQTVLVTSNNNIPMDGIYNDILKLKYKEKDELLFPAIRLGSIENVEKALLKMKKMYEKASHLTARIGRIKQIKENRENAMKSLVDYLDKYDRKTSTSERLEGLKYCKEKCANPFLEVKIDAQIEKVKEELKKIGDVDIEDLEKLMDIDHSELFMAINFETVSRLQKLDKAKFNELAMIIKEVNEDNAKDKATELRKYLSNDENLKKFQEIFPVIISTNLSCTYLGSVGKTFDIVMMDEAGQCSIANALIPISRGSKIMLVGDPQQLKPVIVLDKQINKKLKEKYHIPEEYDYISNSIYTTYTKVDVVNNETLLRSHYRCNNKIISFSNKKYYNNRLKLKSKSNEQKPLTFIDTSSKDNGICEIKNISDTEARTIIQYIKEHEGEKIGIITPFVHQKECIEKYLDDYHCSDISVGTVHAFQGDQKDTIIFSSAITNNTSKVTYNWLKNNRELINVAVSRAKEKLVMLGNKKAAYKLSEGQDDIKELIDYISTEGESDVTNVSPESYALGTRQISTQSEKDLAETVSHALSVINNNCYIKEEVPIDILFKDDAGVTNYFYKQRFDLVVFEKRHGVPDAIMLAIELNGPEHYSDENVIKRDKIKEEFCKKRCVDFQSISRDCARDYGMIKNILKEFIDVKE